MKHMPRTVALAYLTFGVLWIFFTDRALVWMHFPPETVLRMQTTKGWLFIFGSAAFIYLLLKRYERNARLATDRLLESQNQICRMNASLEHRVAARTLQLESANRELEAFAYAVSHDLRAPLRSMSGFSQIVFENAPPSLDEKNLDYLCRIRDASLRMSALIDDLLNLSRISRSEMTPRPTNLTQIATEAAATIRDRYPDREVELTIAPDMTVEGDTRLLRIAMENLLDNAWKYSAHADPARVTVGSQQVDRERVFFVRDNGIGFDMAYSGKLFGPFQRLHAESEFPGTGIGLVTVQRIIARHGGRIWAEAQPDRGATFYFTLGADAQ
ncbi:MAG TPA: ATP-binding protein [Povalibacter sp.]|uniref:sensor histidine kinase n=1 Tax=Povalibacter sp. TaxID=1962978 RepID=UPI002C3B51DE|nr:ATP-binding protein [Povalibacter sp.]HMN46889.1 ATP-binding protein [Povalibacter sp.]